MTMLFLPGVLRGIVPDRWLPMPLASAMSMSPDSRAPAARTSIVIAARNAAATLEQTLDSVLAQSDGSWQALVVDDGSRDDTRRMIERYAARDARIVAQQSGGTGRGAAAARNVGLAAAQGRRVLFLDSDDWLDPSHLQSLNDALDAQPDAIAACCNHRRVMAGGQTAPVRSEAALAVAPMAVFARFCGVAIHAVLIERALVLRVGGFDESLRTCEDWDLWQRIARLGGRWVHVDAALAFYRIGEQTLSHDVAPLMSDAAIVIGRGHGRDDRLCGLDLAHPDGVADPGGEQAAAARACFALWCAGIECGHGRYGAVMAEDLADLPQHAEHTRTLVWTLLDGLTVGLRVVPQELAARWASYGPAVAALIAAFTRNWSDPVAGRRLQYAFERLVLEYDDLAQPRPLLLTLGLRVDLRRPVDVTPPPALDELRRDEWLGLLAVAGQDVELVEGTVIDNIRIAKPNASQDEVIEAARIAGVDEFIEPLPEGYATWVGQQGLRFSGGQRQRIALARAVLRNPQVHTRCLAPALSRPDLARHQPPGDHAGRRRSRRAAGGGAVVPVTRPAAA
jgi:hypothetical protein